MSRDNVEVVRQFKEAINARDADAWAELVAPDFEFRSVFLSVEGRVYRGPEDGRLYLADLAEAFERVHIEIEEQRDLGNGRVLTRMCVRARGKGSGVQTEVPLISIAEVIDGKIATYKTYLDPAEALEAAGLSE